MADEFQKHIFEPFAQEHAGSRTKFAGTGLGMPIAKNLVEKMGGTITFESKEGVGTTFVIRLPFKINLYADKREEQKDVSEKSIKGLHILLAEDNELNMEIAEFMLQNEGADVTKAWNGQEAVELFRNSERICCHCNNWYCLSILSVQRPDHLRCFITIHERHHNIHKNDIKFTRFTFFE